MFCGSGIQEELIWAVLIQDFWCWCGQILAEVVVI